LLITSHLNAREVRAHLIKALGSGRPFEGRLLGMSYSKFDPSRTRKAPSRSLLRRALALACEGHQRTDAEQFSDTGLVYSYGGELDLAIKALTRATLSKGSQRWMWSDLATFYIERYRRSGDSRNLLKALEFSARALSSSSVPLASRFTYALSLEKLSLFALARIAWNDYIVRDPNSA